MQIVPVGEKPDVRPRYLKEVEKGKYEFVESEHRFLIIGDRQENIYINKDGILYFAINDIVLDDATIVEMMWNICKGNYDVIFEDKTKEIMPALCEIRSKALKEYSKPSPTKRFQDDNDSYNGFLHEFETNPADFQLDNTIEIKKDTTTIQQLSFGDFAFGTTQKTDFIELYGYFMFGYQTPWYDDNLGSFLIVVESSSN